MVLTAMLFMRHGLIPVSEALNHTDQTPRRAEIHHFLLLCLAGRKWPGHSRLTVSDWSEEDVSAWLREEGLESLVDTFKANNIDGAELLSLSKESLSSELHIGDATHIHTRTRSFTYSKNLHKCVWCRPVRSFQSRLCLRWRASTTHYKVQ